jgi:hypothetical protein
MQYYYFKRSFFIGFFLFCILGFGAGLAGVINNSHDWSSYLTVILSLILCYVFVKVKTLPNIIIEENGLRKRTFDSPLSNSETTCKWEWIYSIVTSPEEHCTYVDWTKIKDERTLDILLAKKLTYEQNQKYQQLIKEKQIGRICISSLLSGYEQIIAHIVSKTKNVEIIDEATKKIIEKVNSNK